MSIMRFLPGEAFLDQAGNVPGILSAGAQDQAPPSPPIYLHEAKPRGPLESAKLCKKRPKMAKSEPNRTHQKPNLQNGMRFTTPFESGGGQNGLPIRTLCEPKRTHEANPTSSRLEFAIRYPASAHQAQGPSLPAEGPLLELAPTAFSGLALDSKGPILLVDSAGD